MQRAPAGQGPPLTRSLPPGVLAVRPKLTVTIDTHVNSTLLTLEADVRSWQPGDTVVVASTDYSMHQAEEFRVLPCRACAPNQVRVAGRTRARPIPGWWGPGMGLKPRTACIRQQAPLSCHVTKGPVATSRRTTFSCFLLVHLQAVGGSASAG